MSRQFAKVVPLRRIAGEPADMSERALIAACAVGDSAALGALFDRHYPSIHRFVARLSGAPPDDVDDLVQATFLEAYRSAASFAGRSAVRTWLVGIALNVARHHARAEGRRRAALQSVALTDRARQRLPDDAVDQSAAIARVEQALTTMTEPLREAFVLCDLEGLRGTDAAALLGVRQGTLWRRLHEARKLLRAAVEGSDA